MATKTAAHRRAEAAAAYNAFIDGCPTRQVLATIGDKWSALLINAHREDIPADAAVVADPAG